jgi:hypothetical protein
VANLKPAYDTQQKHLHQPEDALLIEAIVDLDKPSIETASAGELYWR